MDGKQLTPEEIATLKKRRQPPSVNNYIRRKVDYLRGLERRGRSDPKAYPRTPDEDNRADVATQVLRYISDDNRFDQIRSSAFENLYVEGMCGGEVIVEPGLPSPGQPQGYEVRFNLFPWDRIFADPHAQHPGFADARYMGVVLWMDREQALGRWPGSETALEASFASASLSNTYDDKPAGYVSWTDNNRSRVRVVQHYWMKGQDWYAATYTRGGFLEQPMRSPYIDHRGNAACPLILRAAYRDRENNCYGGVRDMISPQEAINKRESKLLHLLNVNQVIYEDGAVEDEDRLRVEVAKPDGAIKKNKGFELEIRRDQSEVAGHFQLLQYSVGQMNLFGPNAAMSGKDPREQSGRAILAQQSGGAVEVEPIMDALRQWQHKMMEAAWMRARQFWTDEKMIRVTDDDKNVQFVGLNHPVTLQEELQRLGDPNKALQAMQRLGIQGMNDPRLQTVVRVENGLDDMDVDITIEEGPDTPNLQYEQWQAFTQLPAPVLTQMPLELFISMNPGLKDKDKFLDILRQHQAQQAQGQQAQQAIAQSTAEANLAKTQADAADKIAQSKDRTAQALERMHGMAMDHAGAQTTPVVPGVGAVTPDQNPLLAPPPQPPAPQ